MTTMRERAIEAAQEAITDHMDGQEKASRFQAEAAFEAVIAALSTPDDAMMLSGEEAALKRQRDFVRSIWSAMLKSARRNE